jgi:hypothetical protein
MVVLAEWMRGVWLWVDMHWLNTLVICTTGTECNGRGGNGNPRIVEMES